MAHSDLIIFVREKGGTFSDSQKQEIAFTPDRVGKKIVEFDTGELTWAKKDDVDPSTPIIYLDSDGFISAEEWEKKNLRWLSLL